MAPLHTDVHADERHTSQLSRVFDTPAALTQALEKGASVAADVTFLRGHGTVPRHKLTVASAPSPAPVIAKAARSDSRRTFKAKESQVGLTDNIATPAPKFRSAIPQDCGDVAAPLVRRRR